VPKSSVAVLDGQNAIVSPMSRVGAMRTMGKESGRREECKEEGWI